MRMAAVLLLVGALFGAAPAAAQAAPAAKSAPHAALSSLRGTGSKGGSSGGGISKSSSSGGVSKSGSRRSSGGGFSSRHDYGSSSSTGHKMPLWQAFLVLFLFAGIVIWILVKFVQKVRKAVS